MAKNNHPVIGMSKITHYLKHFFLLEDDSAYQIQDYKDYSGWGFGRFKRSIFFFNPARGESGYLKSEVAGYSEMTKLALLIGATFFVYVAVWADIKIVQLFIDPMFRSFQIVKWFAPALIVGNAGVISFYPRVVFLIKNFSRVTQ